MSKSQGHKKAVKCQRCHRRFANVKGLIAHRANFRCRASEGTSDV